MLLTVGVLTNVVVGSMFAPHAAKELFRFAGQAFMWLTKNPIYLP